jgi:hypothetical protein
MLALVAMALRASRSVAITVRSGYGAEAFGGLIRRVHEASGHAAKVAADATGQYATNWMVGRGKAASPRSAFGTSDADDAVWTLMSRLSHATFTEFVNFSTFLDKDRRAIHHIGPRRMPVVDDLLLWLTARQLIRTFAAAMQIRPATTPPTRFKTAADAVINSEGRLFAELGALNEARRSARAGD